MGDNGAGTGGGASSAGASKAKDKTVLEQGVEFAKENPLAAGAAAATSLTAAITAGNMISNRLKRYSAKKRNQIDIIKDAFDLFLREEFGALKQFQFRPKYRPRYKVKKASFRAVGYHARLDRKLPVFDSLLRTICSYQAQRAKRKVRKGKLSDPTQLFLDEFKEWIVRFSASPMHSEDTLEEAESRRDYVELVIHSGQFYPGKRFNWTDNTFEQTVLSILSILNESLIPMIRNTIADQSVSQQLSRLSNTVKSLVSEVALFGIKVFSDQKGISRQPDELYKDVDELGSSYTTALSLAVREMLTSPDVRSAREKNHVVTSLTEDEYTRQGHRLPANFFVDHRGAPIVPPGVFFFFRSSVPDVDTSPRFFFDQIENASGVASGVLPIFLKDPRIMETHTSLMGRIQHLAACKDLFAQAVQVANTGGNMTICGHREVNTHLGYLLRIVSSLLGEISKSMARLNIAADDAICDIVSVDDEEGRRIDFVKSIKKSRRNAYKEHYKDILSSRARIDELITTCLSTVAPILQELDKASVGDLIADANDAVESFTSNVSRLLGDASDANDTAAASATADAQDADPSAVLEISSNDMVPSSPEPEVARAGSSTADGLIANDDIRAEASEAPSQQAFIRHVMLRNLRLDGELSRHMCDLQIAPHRASVLSVDISKCHITPEAVQHLSNVFVNCPNLKRVRFWLARLGDAGAVVIANLLRREARLGPRLASIRFLDLNENGLGPEAAMAIAEALKAGARIKWLDLGYNDIGDQGAAALGQALLHNHKLQGLVVQHNGIGDAGASVLANCLMNNVCLRHVGLQSNPITDIGALVLADAIASNRTVTQIFLNECHIGDEGATRLLEVMRERERVLVSVCNNARVDPVLDSKILGEETKVRRSVYQDYLKEMA